MQRLYRRHGDCLECEGLIYRGHVDSKFCSEKCRKKFHNAINNAARSWKAKIHSKIIQLYNDRAASTIQAYQVNDKALRKIINSHDFDFDPVPGLVLLHHGFDFGFYSSIEVNPATNDRIYWIYSIGVEVGSDFENLIIRFRTADGTLRLERVV